MEMVKSSQFVSKVIEMNKDYDVYFIEEMIVSRISPADFAYMKEELSPYVNGNEMNAARYAVEYMDSVV